MTWYRLADFGPYDRIMVVARSFQCQPALMPTIRAAAENSNVLETSGRQLRCRTRRAPIGLAQDHDRLSALGQIGDPVGQFGERNINRTWQVPRRRGEFVGLADIEQHDRIASRQPALQFIGLDP